MKSEVAFYSGFLGFLLGVFMTAHYPGFFRSWDSSDDTLYRGDKVSLHLKGKTAKFYKNCRATFLASQAVTDDNVAWVLLDHCDFQNYIPGTGPLTTEVFSLRDLDRIKK